MKHPILCLTLALAISPLMPAQSPDSSSRQSSSSDGGADAASPTAQPAVSATRKTKKQEVHMKPFSQLALGGGISLMGVNLQAATNVNRYLNVRGTGNVFNYSVDNIDVSNFNLNGKVNFATAGVSLDYYPFPTHGFRLSPGVIFYNQNQISASATGTTGSNIKLNGIEFYTDSGTGATPMAVNANLGLNARQQAFSLTTGWGNMIPRKGGHWSFPFELGAVFTGVPTVNVGLTGYACTDQGDAATNGESCVNMATNTLAQSALTAQIAKYKSDLNPAQVYPIFSFGVAYGFHIR